MKTIPTEIGFITSFREFARNTSIRKRALHEKKPIVIEDKKEKEFFFLVPPALYSGLQEMYNDWKNSNDLQQELSNISDKNEAGEDWKSVKSKLLADL